MRVLRINVRRVDRYSSETPIRPPPRLYDRKFIQARILYMDSSSMSR